MTNTNQQLLLSRLLTTIRQYFHARKFTEIEIPVLHTAIPLEENIYPFSTRWLRQDEEQTLFLATSPERTLKIMMSRGIGNCFGIGHTFRNLEAAGSRHLPEFLMLEWYRRSADYTVIMHEVQELILACDEILNGHDHAHFSKEKWPQLSFTQLFLEYVGVTLESILETGMLQKVAKEKGYQTEGASWSQLFDQIFLNEIEPYLPSSPFFLVDFPAIISPLCKKKADQPYLAERFELYINGMELGNGNTESTDVSFIRKNFQTVFSQRQKDSSHPSPIDEEFLIALQKLAKENLAGIGLGVERLAMLLTDLNEISEVQSLPIAPV